MPIKIDTDHVTDAITLDECHERLLESGFDPNDQASFLEVAPILKRLNNNRAFLSEVLQEELEEHCRNQGATNRYTPQVIMLKPAQKGVSFFMRANIWLPGSDPLLAASGQEAFFYQVPHDHNFNFLTSGYLGSGYQSDYYEYEYHDVVGYPGEPVDLQFVERSRLGEGEVMLYRAYRDVHNQSPADDLSVSLNIMPATAFGHLKPQYVFDKRCSRIVQVTATSDSSIEPIMHLAAQFGSGGCMEVIDHLARNSKIEQDRFRAVKALFSARDEPEAKAMILEEYGLRSDSSLVRNMSRSLMTDSGLAG
jgi:hypothetical protein